MIVIDTSVFTDFLVEFDRERHRVAKSFFDEISKRDYIVYEPFLFDVELVGILRRKYELGIVREILHNISEKVELLDEKDLHEFALKLALETHCRAIDSYFIATAKLTSSILVTNDKVMFQNAKKFGVETYCLRDNLNEVLERLKHLL